jgi:hypothetical protein
MADEELGWPFGSSDGGPASRPLVVHLENVLIAMVPDTAAGERAREILSEQGFGPDRVRVYTGEQIVEYDEAFRSGRGMAGRVVGTVVDDREIMGAYVEHGRQGRAAVWVQLRHRDDANPVLRSLSELGPLQVWFHGQRGVEALKLR